MSVSRSEEFEQGHAQEFKKRRRHENQYTYYGRDRQGPAAMTRAEAAKQGFTDGPWYHASDYCDAIRREGFKTKGAENWEIQGACRWILFAPSRKRRPDQRTMNLVHLLVFAFAAIIIGFVAVQISYGGRT